MEYQYEQFIDRIYRDLYKDKKVEKSSNQNDSKYEKIKKYLKRLENIDKKARTSKYHGMELLKELYYDKYIVKGENIPESYFENKKKIALDRGYGHIEISNIEKQQMIDNIINGQKKSLDIWLDYLNSEDSIYPEWFKYYVFQGMVRLGSYNKETSTFNKRTKDTVNTFIELDREALALIYDNLCKYLEKEELNDETLNRLINNGSFSKIYSYMIKKIDEQKKEVLNTEGIWIKYNQGSNPEKLVKDIEGKGTGWCTVGIETANIQLQDGDFYVYYTKNIKGEFSQPRIAIRMEEDNIGEIRGIDEHQNLEPEMEKILEEKLKEFPDRNKYNKKVKDMGKLTYIYEKYKTRNLTNEELRFLYEVDNKIDGFGYVKDPRIEEILKLRNFKEDLSKVLKCSEDEISSSKQDILNGKKIVYFYGNLDLKELKSVENLELPKIINGNLNLSGLNNVEGLVFPKTINGNLWLSKVVNVDSLILPKYVGNSVFFNSLTNAKELVLPETIGEDLWLNNLIVAEGLLFPKTIGENLWLDSLKNAEGLVLPEAIGGSLYLNNLTITKKLILPKYVGNSVFLNRLTSVKGVVLPSEINGDLDLRSLLSTEGLTLPKMISGGLYLNNLTSVENLNLPKKIGKGLYLKSIINANGLMLPETIGGDLCLDNLTNAEGLTLPKTVGGNLYLNKLINAEELVLPKNVGNSVFLNNLISAESLVLPNIINKCLDLRSLTSAKDVIFPEIIHEDLWLFNLKTTEGLIIPQNFNCINLFSTYITMQDLIDKSMENKDEYRK